MMNQSLLAIQQFFALHRKPITIAFLLTEISLVLWWIWIYWQAALDYPSVVAILFQFGPLFAQVAAVLYVVTLLPGILMRLKWYPSFTQPVASSLLIYRRHFGILMFITAFVHLTFSSTIPYFALYNFQPPAPPMLRNFEMMGLIAWIILFPLWLTSNDWAVKKLGKWWKRVHRLTYIALFFIFLHVALQGGSVWALIVGCALFFEVLSWIIFWRRKKRVKN